MQELFNLKGRSLLKISDLSDAELRALLDLADAVKREKKAGLAPRRLQNKNITLIFEKASTRTRAAFAVAAADEGATAEYMGAHDIHLGKKESVKDTARVLGRMFDGIGFRGFKQETVELLAQHSGVPVWNGLTDTEHPTQALADLMTIREHFGRLQGLKVVFIGDGRNNVSLSLMMGCARAGAHFVDCTPRELAPAAACLSGAAAMARASGGSVAVVHEPAAAVGDANVVYTDVWASMGEESRFAERVRLLTPYRVDMELMRRTGNLRSGRAIFLHCLPAFHDNATEFTKEIGALEVADEVFEASFSRVFDQAENRLHTIKSVLLATLTRITTPGGNNSALEGKR